MNSLERVDKCIYVQMKQGVWWVHSQKVWVVILSKVYKMTVLELMCFSAFYINTWSLLYFLRLQGGEL